MIPDGPVLSNDEDRGDAQTCPANTVASRASAIHR